MPHKGACQGYPGHQRQQCRHDGTNTLHPLDKRRMARSHARTLRSRAPGSHYRRRASGQLGEHRLILCIRQTEDSRIADPRRDHKVTAGTWKGAAWSYDAARQVLTINGIELCIQREADWEASPRTHTIVYAGYSGTKTYWGKKSK